MLYNGIHECWASATTGAKQVKTVASNTNCREGTKSSDALLKQPWVQANVSIGAKQVKTVASNTNCREGTKSSDALLKQPWVQANVSIVSHD